MIKSRKRKLKGKRSGSSKRSPKRVHKRSAKRRAVSARPINAQFKGFALAVEPPHNSDPAALTPDFRGRLERALAALAAAGTPFRLVEGFRTRERQQWLYGSGRPGKPFGRPGPIVTNADGVTRLSNHQGDGTTGSGRAADCYPTRDGRVYIPPSADPAWNRYADAVAAEGLTPGHRFRSIKDSPHCELPAS